MAPPPPEAYLKLAAKVQSPVLKVRLVLQAFAAKQHYPTPPPRTPPPAPEKPSDAARFPAQMACRECGVHRAHAVRPLAFRYNGWICGYCVMRMAIRHEGTVDPVHYITTPEEREAVLSLPHSNLTRQRPLTSLLQQEYDEAQAEPERPTFPGKTETRTTKEEAIHAALTREPATVRDLAETTGIAEQSVRDCLASLAAGGWVAHTGTGTKNDPYLYYQIK
jgi:hypothetical protein